MGMGMVVVVPRRMETEHTRRCFWRGETRVDGTGRMERRG